MADSIKTLKLTNGDEITFAALTRAKRKEALKVLRTKGVNPSIADLNLLNGLEMQTEICAVIWTGWKRCVDGELVETTKKERREAIDEIDGLPEKIVKLASEFAEECAKGYEVEEKNS